MPPEHVPERWRSRALRLALVPLTVDEGTTLLVGEPVEPSLGAEEELLLRLVSRGLAVPSIAKELGLSTRGVQHRLARLRQRLGVGSTSELTALAARRGF